MHAVCDWTLEKQKNIEKETNKIYKPHKQIYKPEQNQNTQNVGGWVFFIISIYAC